MTLFSDYFEDADNEFPSWTGKSGSPTVQDSVKHHNEYAARIPLNSRIYKIFPDQDIVYARAYVRWTSNPSSGNQAWLFNLGSANGTGTLVYVRIVNDSGTMKWGLITYDNTANFTYDLFTGVSKPNVNMWYCVELKWQKNTANGAALYVNGELIGRTTAITHNSQVDTLNLWLEQTEITAYYDCVVVSENYIGPDQLEVNNLYVNSDLKLQCNVPHLSQQDIVDAIYKWIGTTWAPEGLPVDDTDSKIMFKDNVDNLVCHLLSIISVDDTHFPPWKDPLLATDVGLIVQKDIAAGGFISTQQGEVWIGHGRRTQDDVPKIILMHADPDGYAPGYGTLYLRKLLIEDEIPSVEEPGNLDLGDLTAHGYIYANNLSPIPAQNWIDVNSKLRINGDLQLVNGHVVSSLNPSGSVALGSPTEPWTGVVAATAYTNTLTPISPATTINVSGVLSCSGAVHGGGSSGDAFKVGDDMYLVDVNEANTVCLQGAQDRANAKIYFGSGKDTNLYRSAPDVLKTDDSFICGNITGNDAVFNSVKGTYSGAAVKAGDYLTLSWDTNYSHITAHNRDLWLNTDSGKNVYVARGLATVDYLSTSGIVYAPYMRPKNGDNTGGIGEGNLRWCYICGVTGYFDYLGANVSDFIYAKKNIVPETANYVSLGTPSLYWNSAWVNYVRYKNIGSFGCARELADTPIERKFQTVDHAKEFLRHELTKEWRHLPYGEEENTVRCVCGKEGVSPCPEHREQWEDIYVLKTGDMIEASAKLVLELFDRVVNLESQLKGMKVAG